MGTQVWRPLHLGKTWPDFLYNVADHLPDRRCNCSHGTTHTDGAQNAANVSRNEGTSDKRYCLSVRGVNYSEYIVVRSLILTYSTLGRSNLHSMEHPQHFLQ